MNAGRNLSDYVLDSLLSFQSTVWSTNTLGLSGGTLYDVLEISSGVGNVSVNATGLDITCGYPKKTSMHFVDDFWELRLDGVNFTYEIDSTHYILLYSTIPIVDSNNSTGKMVNLSRPMRDSVSAIQILQCTQTLVPQTAVVDSQTRQIITVDKTMENEASTWRPYTPASGQNNTFVQNGNLLIESVGTWHCDVPQSPFNLDYDSGEAVTVADLQVPNPKAEFVAAGFQPTPQCDSTRRGKCPLRPSRINVLDKQACFHISYNPSTHLVLSVGNIPATHGPLVTQFTKGHISGYGFESVTNPPFLLQGNATVTQISVEGRLDLSIIALGAGLAASVTLLLLSLSFSLSGARDDKEIPMDGIGILHAIWLYRNHPELERLMPHVENPTDNNLREAGMMVSTSTRVAQNEEPESPVYTRSDDWRSG
ncbi:hypothetical protein B0H13DRAFT_2335168 [Mycena leptocephala]|nr:hypothetical protein B0H13DRAFT_2335168 [Mycena leptocephala]